MRKIYTFLGPLGFVLIWWLIAAFNLADSFFFPGPKETLIALVNLLGGDLVKDILATLSRTMQSFALATIIGVPLGLLLGKAENAYRSIEFIIDFFRSTPATALFPLFLLVFGIADASKIAAATFGGLLIILFNTAYGVINSKKIRILAARLAGASRWQIFRWIVFWESLPQTFVGLRNAISLTLTIVVVTEMFVGTNVGIGRRIIDFQVVFNIPAMYAAIIAAGMMGYLLNYCLRAIEQRLVHWKQ